MNKKILQEIIKHEYSRQLLEYKITNISKYYVGRCPWYNHLKPLSDARNKLYKWEEIFRKAGINPSTVFSVGDEMINNTRSILWFKCDKKNVDPVDFVHKLYNTNNKYYSRGSWRLVEETDAFFILEYDIDL